MIEVEYICAPSYFHMGDIIFDILNLIILLLVGFFSFYAYRCVKSNTNVCNSRFLLMGGAYSLLALAFGIKAFADYQFSVSELVIHSVMITDMSFQSLCVIGGFLVYRILTLIALLTIFVLVTKNISLSTYAVIALSLFNVFFFAQNFVAFYATSSILLFFIGLSYLQDFKKTKHKTQQLLSYSFILLAISYALFLFISQVAELYVVAKILRLIGFIVLLISFIRVFKHGKKKK